MYLCQLTLAQVRQDSDAGSCISTRSAVRTRSSRNAQTFHELLASVLLVEGLMLNRRAQVINHDIKEGADLFFRVARVMNEELILGRELVR